MRVGRSPALLLMRERNGYTGCRGMATGGCLLARTAQLERPLLDDVSTHREAARGVGRRGLYPHLTTAIQWAGRGWRVVRVLVCATRAAERVEGYVCRCDT